jgi:hypothetical protein
LDTLYPEIVSACRPNISAIPHSIRHQSWAKITSNINRIASLPAEAAPETEDKEEETQRKPFVALYMYLVPFMAYAVEAHTFGTPLLLGSFSAKMTNINRALAINSEKNWLVLVRNGCGYVQNIAAVAFGAGGTVLRPPSK